MHGGDQFWAGAQSVYDGMPHQTLTSELLQTYAGMTATEAALADASISLVGVMGGSTYISATLAAAEGSAGAAETGAGPGKVGVGSGGPGTDGPVANPIADLPRTGSAFKSDEFHAFPDIVDNFAGDAAIFPLPNGATLLQLEGSLNGRIGRFEWMVDKGMVTHRLFVPEGTTNGVPCKP